MKTSLVLGFVLFTSAFLAVSDAKAVEEKIKDKKAQVKTEEDILQEEILLEDITSMVEEGTQKMDASARDGFLSNLSTAFTNAMESIRERLPEMPSWLARPTEAPAAVVAASDSD